MRINKPKLEWDTFLDNNLNDRTEEKFNNLHRFYKSTDGQFHYTNMEDAVGSISQVEWIAIAELLKEGKAAAVGCALQDALMRICKTEARYELMEEFDKLTEGDDD